MSPGDEPAPAQPRSPALVVATLAVGGTVVSVQQTLMLPILPDFPRLLNTTVDNVDDVRRDAESGDTAHR